MRGRWTRRPIRTTPTWAGGQIGRSRDSQEARGEIVRRPGAGKVRMPGGAIEMRPGAEIVRSEFLTTQKF